MISAIVAVDNDWGIGYNGELLEHIPEDLKYFKALTTGHTVVMGRKTWDSLPKKPLPNRINIIITRNSIFYKYTEKSINYKCLNLQETIDLIVNSFNSDIFIIGGGTIYKELLPFCERVYVTKIHKSHENVDTYFPNLDEMEDWYCSVVGELQTYNDISYSFCQYERL